MKDLCQPLFFQHFDQTDFVNLKIDNPEKLTNQIKKFIQE